MSQYQTHLPKKWKPKATDRVLRMMHMGVHYSPSYVAKILRETQSSISQAMINLHRYGLLDREPCPCGRGFIYWRIK